MSAAFASSWQPKHSSFSIRWMQTLHAITGSVGAVIALLAVWQYFIERSQKTVSDLDFVLLRSALTSSIVFSIANFGFAFFDSFSSDLQPTVLVICDVCYDATTLIGYLCIGYIMHLSTVASRVAIDLNTSEEARARDRRSFLILAIALALVFVAVNVARPLTDKAAFSAIVFISLVAYTLIVLGNGWICIYQLHEFLSSTWKPLPSADDNSIQSTASTRPRSSRSTSQSLGPFVRLTAAFSAALCLGAALQIYKAVDLLQNGGFSDNGPAYFSKGAPRGVDWFAPMIVFVQAMALMYAWRHPCPPPVTYSTVAESIRPTRRVLRDNKSSNVTINTSTPTHISSGSADWQSSQGYTRLVERSSDSDIKIDVKADIKSDVKDITSGSRISSRSNSSPRSNTSPRKKSGSAQSPRRPPPQLNDRMLDEPLLAGAGNQHGSPLMAALHGKGMQATLDDDSLNV